MFILILGDVCQLRQVVLSFDFLLMAVHTVSICFALKVLRKLSEQLLDWELEQVLRVMSMAVPTLSRDSTQLACELIGWLRPLGGRSRKIPRVNEY